MAGVCLSRYRSFKSAARAATAIRQTTSGTIVLRLAISSILGSRIDRAHCRESPGNGCGAPLANATGSAEELDYNDSVDRPPAGAGTKHYERHRAPNDRERVEARVVMESMALPHAQGQEHRERPNIGSQED